MALTMAGRDFESCFTEVWDDFCRDYPPKTEQKEALRAVCEDQKHTFCLLPTGFGKSDIFGLASMILDKVCQETVISNAINDTYRDVFIIYNITKHFIRH